MEYFLINKLNIEDSQSKEIMSCLFVLYDLRLLQGHFQDSGFDEKYDFCKARLGIDKDSKHFSVYERLVEKLISTFKQLKEITKSLDIN